MRRVFHLAQAGAWQRFAEEPREACWNPPSLAREGFVHLSFAEQLGGTLDAHFGAHHALVLLELEPALLAADAFVGALQNGQEEAFLAVEVVVDEPLVEPGALGDAVHARAAQAMLGKLGQRGIEDVLLRAVGVARARFGSGGFEHEQ